MLKKNLTPFLIGTKLISRRPPRPELMLVVRASFSIQPGGALLPIEGMTEQRFLSGDVFAEDDTDMLGECVFPSDFADIKLNAEVFLKGHCHVAGDKPLPECLVRFSVGAWNKTLRVLGRRVFSDAMPGAMASSPAPFTKMPLSYANAYGGPGFAKNPVGKGFGDELPRVEYPHDPMKSRGQKIEVAGFGPINAAWPQRVGKMGKQYGKAWRETRAPFYAEDFDWSYFQEAPADQQISGYLKGDEELVFQNLHEREPTLRVKLPGIRIRAFVNDTEGRFRELGTVLDTLLADLDRNVIELSFRGAAEVRDLDFEDIKTLVVASEPLGKKPLSEEYYREILTAFEKDPVGLADALPEHFEEVIQRQKAIREGNPPPLRTDLDPISARVDQQLGAFGAKITEELQKRIAEAREKAAPHQDITPDLDKAAQQLDDSPPMSRVQKPGGMPPLGLRKSMRKLLEEVGKVKESLNRQDIPPDERRRIESKVTELEAVPHDPRWKELDPAYTPPLGPLSTDEPGPGRDLSDRDFTGVDFQGMDLSGANFEGAILTRANLAGANLRGANLRVTVLFKANLSGARLGGADFYRANAAHVLAKQADFSEALLEMAFFEDADLTGAILSKAKGAYAIFARAKLHGLKAEGANFEHVDFGEAQMDDALLDGSFLVNALFSETVARRARFKGAKLGGASFAKANLSHAIVWGASGDKLSFEGAVLDYADFRHVDFTNAHFSKVQANSTLFVRANLPMARFYKAKLENADATQANLLQADFSYARLNRTKMVKANLYMASFVGTSGSNTDFTDSNLKKSTLERVL